jgi:hypothetical protein
MRQEYGSIEQYKGRIKQCNHGVMYARVEQCKHGEKKCKHGERYILIPLHLSPLLSRLGTP